MSQSGAAQLRPAHVTNHMQALAAAQASLLTSVAEAQDAVLDGALIYGGLEQADKVSAVRAKLASLLQMRHEVEGYAASLNSLAARYQPTVAAATDFEAELASEAAGRSFDPERTDAMREFDQFARAEDGPGGEDLEDDDIVVTGNDFMNAACPISGKNVLELADPVEDEKGYVYDRAAITAHIRQRGYNGACDAPFPGVSHSVVLSRLKPAARVLRAQKRRRLGLDAQRGTQGGAGGSGAGIEVIDV
ncbi:hypothetical protein Rsub_05062 [Raphidocelis subcapitata]|uniref:U-box domain-containing protein n=1 Tax=Raphidocelis subcapitata TaxID=307507 RepID=A0A2V0P4B2_9CHLO|nr:hypothetical protein Rsub_05062 [Raphidocelis subcapitata]|eukprot:GBF92693.1 hypothetical protein Rsub_05062 [Raphidocelis subcapitata]